MLITSALWIAGGGWFLYFLYNLFHVPAERWLGTGRWLLVLAIAHVGATYSARASCSGRSTTAMPRSPPATPWTTASATHSRGSRAVLVYLVVKPWRYVYLAGLLLFYGSALITGRTFTDVGHFSAVLLGLACYPVTRGRPTTAVGGPFDPVATARRLWRRVRRTEQARVSG